MSSWIQVFERKTLKGGMNIVTAPAKSMLVVHIKPSDRNTIIPDFTYHASGSGGSIFQRLIKDGGMVEVELPEGATGFSQLVKVKGGFR